MSGGIAMLLFSDSIKKTLLKVETGNTEVNS